MGVYQIEIVIQPDFDEIVKSPNPVTPANAGVQKLLKRLDSGLAVIPDPDPGRNDNKLIF